MDKPGDLTLHLNIFRASSVDQDDATRDSALSSERLTNGNGSSELGTTNGSEPGTRNVSEDESHHNVR